MPRNNRTPSTTLRASPYGYQGRTLPSYSSTRPGPRAQSSVSGRPSLTREPQPTISWKRKVQYALLTFAVIVFASHSLWALHVSADEAASKRAHALAVTEAKQRSDGFSSRLQSMIAANPGIDFSVATYSPLSGSHSYGDSAPFDGASTGKLITASYYLHQVQLGATGLQTNIDGQTANHWLQAMLVNSDDTAWAELNGYLGHANLAQYATSIGFTNYDVSTNSFTASDIANLLQKLMSGSLLASPEQQLMLGYMKQANYRNFIVAAVPSNDTVYHKVGMDADDVNDAAIISSNNNYMVLVIFTNGNGTYDWNNRATIIQAMTRDAIQSYL